MPSSIKSFTPVTVACWGVLQFALVNVNEGGATVPSEVSLEESPIVTSAVGWLSSTIVKFWADPASVVTRPDVGFTVIPATSSSLFVAVTSDTVFPL